MLLKTVMEPLNDNRNLNGEVLIFKPEMLSKRNHAYAWLSVTVIQILFMLMNEINRISFNSGELRHVLKKLGSSRALSRFYTRVDKLRLLIG